VALIFSLLRRVKAKFAESGAGLMAGRKFLFPEVAHKARITPMSTSAASRHSAGYP
jgi:hypothetical protein